MGAHAWDESDVPPLEAGDRLDQAEFHRRYLASPQIKKAELVEGVVYVASPVKNGHSEQHGHIMTVLGLYAAATPGARIADNGTVILGGDSEVQPDALLRREHGTCVETPDGYLKGPPELVFEVASSSTAYDLNQKRTVYRVAGVREYAVLVVRERRVRWFDLVDGDHIERDPPEDGVFRSVVFPGFWLDSNALLRGDLAALIVTARSGLDAG